MKIIGTGMNYAAHAAELGRSAMQDKKHLVFFLKPETALLTRNRPFYIPDFSTHITIKR